MHWAIIGSSSTYPSVGEGFWRQTKASGTSLPYPEQGSSGISSEFKKKLEAIQKDTRMSRYCGLSKCRICHKDNGSGEYKIHTVYNGVEVELRWPEGYMHYLTKHKIKPSREFMEMINLGKATLKSMKKSKRK